MTLHFLFRAKIILPVIFAFFLTPVPKRLGFYEYLFSNPALVGILPCSIRSEEQWGYTFEEFYGDGSNEGSEKEYRNRLWGQTALVTGANAGVGYETSLALARLGVSVTMACRNPSKCETAANQIREDEIVIRRGKEGIGSIVATMTVDTSSLKSVKKFCREFQAQTNDNDGAGNFMPLDMLFLNAGMGATPPKDDGSSKLSEDGIELTFATNVVGHHLMYKLLEPNVRDSGELRKTPARIVLTSSSASYDTKYPYKVATDLETLNGDPIINMSHYAQSKLAQILWAKELTAQLDAEANDTRISSNDIDPNSIIYVNAAHPGAVATGIWDKAEMPEIVRTIISILLKPIMWTPVEGALTLIYLGTAVEQLQKGIIRGQYYHPQSKRILDHKDAKDDPETKILQEKLWKFLDELVADYV